MKISSSSLTGNGVAFLCATFSNGVYIFSSCTFTRSAVYSEKHFYTHCFIRAKKIAICIFFLLFSMASTVSAEIELSGDVNPLDVNTWPTVDKVYIGNSSAGTVTVDDGSILQSRITYLGYDVGSSGTTTVTDMESKWATTYFYIGYQGDGTLNIEAGGKVSTSNGTIQNYLGYGPSSHGTITVTGAESKLSCGNLLVGYYGSGNLTVSEGGTVVVNQTLFTSLDCLFGNGTILTNKAVLDADLVFDVTHGLQQTFAFGTGGSLIIKPNEMTADLGAGYKRNGTLRIAEGVTITSGNGYLGYHSGSKGTATVTGSGSNWTGNNFYIGNNGNGELNIEAGGQVDSATGYLGYGQGTAGTVTVTGTDSLWRNGGIHAGYSGEGTLDIKLGGRVVANVGYLGYKIGSTGTINVSGAGSEFKCYYDLYVGNGGTGMLSIELGGQVSNNICYVGSSNSSPFSTVSVTGPGSKWTINGSLTVGSNYGRGIVDIKEGGQATSNNNTYLGNGFNSAANATGTVTVSGTNSKWTENSILYVGYKGKGDLTVEKGGQVTVASNLEGCHLGYNAGSSGTVTVRDKNSQLIINKSLYVGYDGSGELNIEAEAQVTNVTGYLGDHSAGSIGTVKVTGSGSKWTNSQNLYIGYVGGGVLNIENGGQLISYNGYLGYSTSATGAVKVTGAGQNGPPNRFILAT